jgi:hypothetical protein
MIACNFVLKSYDLEEFSAPAFRFYLQEHNVEVTDHSETTPRHISVS